MTRLAVLVSGSGTNLQAIIDATERGDLPGGEIALVVANRREAYGIRRAIAHGIPVIYFPLLPYTKRRVPARTTTPIWRASSAASASTGSSSPAGCTSSATP